MYVSLLLRRLGYQQCLQSRIVAACRNPGGLGAAEYHAVILILLRRVNMNARHANRIPSWPLRPGRLVPPPRSAHLTRDIAFFAGSLWLAGVGATPGRPGRFSRSCGLCRLRPVVAVRGDRGVDNRHGACRREPPGPWTTSRWTAPAAAPRSRPVHGAGLGENCRGTVVVAASETVTVPRHDGWPGRRTSRVPARRRVPGTVRRVVRWRSQTVVGR